MSKGRRELLIDIAIAMAVGVVLILRASAPLEPDAPPPDWRSYTLVTGMALAMLFRRRHPTATLVTTLVFFTAYYALGLGAIGAIWPIAPAVMSAAYYGHTITAVTAATWTLLASSAWRFFFDPEDPTLQTVNDVVSDAALAAAVILAGAMIRNHRLLRAEMTAREEAVAAERDAESKQRMSEERLAIAREVHDVVAHGLAGIGVQARVADELLGSDPAAAKTAVRAIIDSTSEAMRQLRATVGGLRSAPLEAQAPSLADIVAGVSGVDVALHVEEDLALSERSRTVVRAVVREALTNVVRHSGADRAEVTVTGEGDWASVTVRDEGRGGPYTEGHGLKGMRERVSAIGGSLHAGATATGGFEVRVVVPR